MVVDVIVCDKGCNVRVILNVKYGDRVEEWVGENVVMADVLNGVLPYRAIVTYNRYEVRRIMCNRGLCGGGVVIMPCCSICILPASMCSP